jgi:hypothetical protein
MRWSLAVGRSPRLALEPWTTLLLLRPLLLLGARWIGAGAWLWVWVLVGPVGWAPIWPGGRRLVLGLGQVGRAGGMMGLGTCSTWLGWDLYLTLEVRVYVDCLALGHRGLGDGWGTRLNGVLRLWLCISLRWLLAGAGFVCALGDERGDRTGPLLAGLVGLKVKPAPSKVPCRRPTHHGLVRMKATPWGRPGAARKPREATARARARARPPHPHPVHQGLGMLL